MWTKNNKVKCDHCGRFIGYNQPYYGDFWLEYSYSGDEPIEVSAEYHKSCVEKYNISVKGFTLYNDCMYEES